MMIAVLNRCRFILAGGNPMGVSRRRFCFSLAGLPAMLATPALAAPQTVGHGGTLLTAIDAINMLEASLRAHPDSFDWTIHNELRHLYAPINEQRSMQHMDTILAHSVMDSYMLDILSEWQLEDDPDLAIVNLLDKVTQYPSLLHLAAACLIKIGEVSTAAGNSSEAHRMYQHVLTLCEENVHRVPTLRRYELLARYGLHKAQA
jgi:hypothetical protein